MCGITGVIDLRGRRNIDPVMLQRMAEAIIHRGPDEDGFLLEPGVGLANRRLSIVGLADGRQPIFNEDRSVAVVFNGELFDYVEKREWLESRGHVFRTSADTEVLVHMWEEYGEEMLPHLRGQFGFALYDTRRGVVILARDRLGICPLHWARRGDWLYFGSEIKAILASGQVQPQVDPLGLDHIFTFFGLGTRRTVFKDISAVHPAAFLKIDLGADDRSADITEHRYWDLDFPDQGDEFDPQDPRQAIDGFDAVFRRAVEIRLRADVPVVGYLSGGVDSTSVMSMATRVMGRPIPAFTIRITAKGLDETDRALMAAERIGSHPTVVTCGGDVISREYPKLVTAAEAPVMDTSCSALFSLAKEVHRQGYKVALTGEGGDEALAGYPWFKIYRAFGLTGNTIGNLARRTWVRINTPDASWDYFRDIQTLLEGPNASAELYGLVSLSRQRFYSDSMWEQVGKRSAFEDLDLNRARMRKWHPMNRSIYVGYKTMLAALLMNHKGDRPAMANSVETRYPLLDEDVVQYCANIHPRWKLKGLNRDKHLLRTWAAEHLPKAIANRPKAMFRAPFANTFFVNPPPFVDQLLSEESLRKTGYFNSAQVQQYRSMYNTYRFSIGKRQVVEMGLTGVMATQLWHHVYLGGGLCELPTWSPPQVDASAPLPTIGVRSE